MKRLLFALAVVTTAALGGVLLTSARGSILYAALAFAAALYLVLEPAEAQRPRRLPEPAASPSPARRSPSASAAPAAGLPS